MHPQWQPHPQPNPDLPHLLVWPATIFALTALGVAVITPAAIYSISIGISGAAIAACVPGLILGFRRQYRLAGVAVVNVLLGLVALAFGIADFVEFQDTLGDIRDTFRQLPF